MNLDARAPSLEAPDIADAIDPPRAHGAPPVRGVLRAEPEHFQVDELPLAAPDDDGTHAWLEVRKRGANTQWVAAALARHAGVPLVDVGFAGLKDRHAVTTQWFSVALQGRPEPDWTRLEEPGVTVLQTRRGRRKLRRGELAGNRFRLRVSALEGDLDALAARLETVAAAGVPNYFGAQRFGHDGGNLEQARAMFEKRSRVRDRHRRGLYLSAARSLLFNRVLAWRVRGECWSRVLPGDVLVDADGIVGLPGEALPDEPRRVQALASLLVHPSGPLWGRGRPLVSGETLALECEALAALAAWQTALEHAGLAQERRALRVAASELRWDIDRRAEALDVAFSLPAGAYATGVATGVLRELALTGEDRG